jgi:septal ring factor EnvC (AmiA/AmiB activator)
VSYDLIGHVVTILLMIYFGVHLRTQLRTVRSTVEAQKVTIDAQAEQMKTLKTTIEAQAEQMKAQSTVLQDVERLNKMMQQAIDYREQAYKELVGRDATTRRRERIATWYAAVSPDDFDRRLFVASEAYATLKVHLPEALQQELERSRNPMYVVALPISGIDSIQARLLEEIAKVEWYWGLTSV